MFVTPGVCLCVCNEAILSCAPHICCLLHVLNHRTSNVAQVGHVPFAAIELFDDSPQLDGEDSDDDKDEKNGIRMVRTAGSFRYKRASFAIALFADPSPWPTSVLRTPSWLI